jgi:hypothetical protein
VEAAPTLGGLFFCQPDYLKTDSLALELLYDFKDRKANIADATYDSHVTALRLNFRR